MKRFLINDQGLQENLLTPNTAIINLSSLRFKPRTVQRHVPSQKSPLPPFGKGGLGEISEIRYQIGFLLGKTAKEIPIVELIVPLKYLSRRDSRVAKRQ